MWTGREDNNMTPDVVTTDKLLPPDNIVPFERMAELKKHQTALSKYLQLLRAAKIAKV